ncbi:EDR2L, partial [Symbiodinium microadriaticum]
YKLIPNVVDGNWVVRNAMPAAVPCLLGQKVQQRYFRTPDYVEIDVDVGSSAIATNVIGVLRGYARHVKVQYGTQVVCNYILFHCNGHVNDESR